MDNKNASALTFNTCVYHPGEKIIARCQKFGRAYCKKCFDEGIARCSSPKMHCPFRSSCMVWFLTHLGEAKKQEKKAKENAVYNSS